MSATYNWAYKPGVTNKYGIAIAASADDVRPSNACYVALFGNDATGNGSREYPYRTIGKAATISGTVIIGSGVYREDIPFANYYGDGDVRLECIFNTFTSDINLNGVSLTTTAVIPYPGNINYSNLNIVGYGAVGEFTLYSNIFNLNGGNFLVRNNPYSSINGNNTFLNTRFLFQSGANIYGYMASCIFENCKFDITDNVVWDYSLFHNCQFRMGSSGDYTAINDLPTFLAFIRAVYPTNIGFTHCAFADPLFNNPAIGDYTLAFNSPAKNLSYFGTYVGAKSIAYSIKAKATEAAGDFDFSSAVNLNIADDSITFIDPTIDAQIDTNVIPNLLGREIANFPSYGFNADRNGQYIDSIPDLDTSTKAAGDTLTVPTPYLVEIGAIVYNGATYQPGERFTSVSGHTTFTTVAAGVVREILEAPQRHTIMARFSDGGDSVTAGDALVTDNYYFVESGTVTYDSNVITAPAVFKAVDANAFSGSGSVILAFSIESFEHYEPGIKPTSNNTADSRTGSIIRGNGDPAYVRGGLGIQEFPINAKFIQIRYFIRANNLKP